MFRSLAPRACAVVAVTLVGPLAHAESIVTAGTGFAINTTGGIITNAHVVSGCAIILVDQPNVRHRGRVVVWDEKADLALIEIPAKTATFAVLRTSPALRAGEQVSTFGFPLTGALASEGNITSGNVSSLRGLGDDATRIQIST